MLYYRLNKNLEAEKLIRDIQKLIQQQDSADNRNKVLIVSISNIIDHTGDSPLPKLEYKHDN
jgi:hypothetical protein